MKENTTGRLFIAEKPPVLMDGASAGESNTIPNARWLVCRTGIMR